MKSKKGSIVGLICIILSIVIIIGVYSWWQKISAKSIEDVAKKASKEAGVEIDAQNTSPQGQVNAVRDTVNKIQDKENARMEKEMKK